MSPVWRLCLAWVGVRTPTGKLRTPKSFCSGGRTRETHPIFFHHLLKGIHNGARLFTIDPRRTSSAQWADAWLGLDVGSDIALANAVGREIIASGLENRQFIEHATTGFESYRQGVEPYTLAYAEKETGVPARTIREMAHAYAGANRAISVGPWGSRNTTMRSITYSH